MSGRHGVLVLGGSGFLGAWLLRVLARDPLAAQPISSACRAPQRGPVRGPGIREHRFDLEAPGEPEALVEALRPGVVIATAALARAADCQREPDRAQRVNAEGPGRLARACRIVGARLVLVSTDLVFGRVPPPPSGFREEHRPDPLGVYGRSKLEGERRALAAGGEVLVVRLPLLYGPSFGRGLGASDSLLAAVAAGRRPRLFTDEWRTPLEVRNAAEALAELARSRLTGCLHVAGPERLTRYELGRAVLRAAGHADASRLQPARRAEVDAGAPRPADTSLDASRARALLATELLGVSVGLARAWPDSP